MTLSGWGNFPRLAARVSAPRTLDDLRAQIAQGASIARGNGRAYGDSAINAANTIDMRGFNHMLAFDEQSGQLIAEAGVLLADVIAVFLPRGWFPAVTPGTKFVTLGGMVAADVHGKNHHRDGSLRAFVDWIELVNADGELLRCSHDENPRLFDYTLGGMGLTGVILRVALRLRKVESGWIKQDMRPAANLTEAMRLFEDNAAATYSVAWIDCLARGDNLGRSLVMFGEHASIHDLAQDKRAHPFDTPHKRAKTFPFYAPSFVLNRVSLGLFNALYYKMGKQRAGQSLIDWDAYFYPLDAILEWNRLYGRKGFAQFQCAIPLTSAQAAMEDLLGTISAAGQGLFLAVLKRFGKGDGGFSFPMEGYTLALDFPVNPHSLALLERLDAIVLAHGGRFYLAKDSRMSADVFARSEQRIDQFMELRRSCGAVSRFSSAQSERLGM